MSRRLSCFAVVLTLVAAHQARAAEPLKGLLITGGCCHDYGNQAQIITEGISQRANIEWDVVHEGGTSRDFRISVYEEDDWASGYDVIVHNECFGAVEDAEFVESIADAHFKGVPAVFIHCALHSYRSAGVGADAWRELIGVTSRSHEGKRSLEVRRMEDHPVMTDFPVSWATPNGELYKIEHVWPNCTPLAVAYGQDTEQDHIVAWTNTFGEARIFGTSLGHHNETMNNDTWLGMVARGVLWACEKLDEDGEPLESFAGSGIEPIELKPLEPVADE